MEATGGCWRHVELIVAGQAGYLAADVDAVPAEHPPWSIPRRRPFPVQAGYRLCVSALPYVKSNRQGLPRALDREPTALLTAMNERPVEKGYECRLNGRFWIRQH